MDVTESPEARLGLRKTRIVLGCILSSGLYSFYWFYLTWKQLREETGNPHYHPIWHSLGMLVPIYVWFVGHRHLNAIKEVQNKAGIKPSLDIGGALTLFVLSNVVPLQWAWRGYPVTPTLILSIISVALLAVCLVWSQSNLNIYWAHTRGGRLTEARIGAGEIILVVVGLAIWMMYVLWFPPLPVAS